MNIALDEIANNYNIEGINKRLLSDIVTLLSNNVYCSYSEDYNDTNIDIRIEKDDNSLPRYKDYLEKHIIEKIITIMNNCEIKKYDIDDNLKDNIFNYHYSRVFILVKNNKYIREKIKEQKDQLDGVSEYESI